MVILVILFTFASGIVACSSSSVLGSSCTMDDGEPAYDVLLGLYDDWDPDRFFRNREFEHIVTGIYGRMILQERAVDGWEELRIKIARLDVPECADEAYLSLSELVEHSLATFVWPTYIGSAWDEDEYEFQLALEYEAKFLAQPGKIKP